MRGTTGHLKVIDVHRVYRRRNVCCVGGGNGVELIDSLVTIGKSSDGEQSGVYTDGSREESAEVMTRSRVWYLL